MKINIKNILIILVIILVLTLSFGVLNNPNILFIGNIIVCILICIKAKFSLFTLKSFLINYVLISVAFQYNTGESYGILELGIFPLQYEMMNIISLIYNIIMFFYISNTDILSREEEMQKHNAKESKVFSTICALIAIIFSIIAFPNLNFSFESSTRFNSLLPGNAWNHVVVIALIFAIPNFKDSKMVKFSYVFCITWFLLHSERVDVLGLVIALLIILMINRKDMVKKIFAIKNLKYYIIGIIVVLLLVYIGEYRAGNKNIDFETMFRKVLVQNTAADVGYVYNSSILYTESHGFEYGKTYLLYLIKLIPFISTDIYDASIILQKEYYTAGGILNLSEPYMNFGIIGVIIFAIVELTLINLIIRRKRNYNFFLYIFLLATVFRVTWYGLMYIEKGVVYIIPIMYVLYILIEKNLKRFTNNN